MDEAKELVGKVKTLIQDTDIGKFDWDLTDSDQGNFDTKMMAFLWFKDGVTPQVRKRAQLDLQQSLADKPIPVKGADVRATLELDPEKRPWKKAQAIFIGAMREHAGLPRATFDIRWVNTGLRVSVNMSSPGCATVVPTPIASFTIGTSWVLGPRKIQDFCTESGRQSTTDIFE